MAARWAAPSLARHAQQHGWRVWVMLDDSPLIQTVVVYRDDAWSSSAWAQWTNGKLSSIGVRTDGKGKPVSLKALVKFVSDNPGSNHA